MTKPSPAKRDAASDSAPPAHSDADRQTDTGDDAPAGGQVSEAGGASLNEETSEGGADAVPDSHG